MNRENLLELLRQEGCSEFIVSAFHDVDRALFIPQDAREFAYFNEALAIGEGATISQPSTIAFMLSLLELEKLSGKQNVIILEIGSGSGYVLALMNTILKKLHIQHYEIIGLEIIDSLVKKSQGVLRHEPCITIFKKNGAGGYPQKAAFDRIIASAAFHAIPSHLFDQLTEGGILVCPVRNSIWQFKKLNGKVSSHEYGGFVFVPVIESAE